jgi:hypothetical protein
MSAELRVALLDALQTVVDSRRHRLPRALLASAEQALAASQAQRRGQLLGQHLALEARSSDALEIVVALGISKLTLELA